MKLFCFLFIFTKVLATCGQENPAPCGQGDTNPCGQGDSAPCIQGDTNESDLQSNDREAKIQRYKEILEKYRQWKASRNE